MLSGTTEEERALSAAADAVMDALHDSTNVGAPAKRARAPAAAGSGAAASASAKRPRLPQSAHADDGPLLKGVHFLAIEDDLDRVLHAVQPVFVILYDLQLSWVRQLEVYQSLHPNRPLKVRCHDYLRDEEARVSSDLTRYQAGVCSTPREHASEHTSVKVQLFGVAVNVRGVHLMPLLLRRCTC
jgi:hypothetical protein